jgi:hypothetical protein
LWYWHPVTAVPVIVAPVASKIWVDKTPPVHEVVVFEHKVTIPLTRVYPAAATVQFEAETWVMQLALLATHELPAAVPVK